MPGRQARQVFGERVVSRGSLRDPTLVRGANHDYHLRIAFSRLRFPAAISSRTSAALRATSACRVGIGICDRGQAPRPVDPADKGQARTLVGDNQAGTGADASNRPQLQKAQLQKVELGGWRRQDDCGWCWRVPGDELTQNAEVFSVGFSAGANHQTGEVVAMLQPTSGLDLLTYAGLAGVGGGCHDQQVHERVIHSENRG